jgi:DNA-binding CsgD family transcriptional regulator
MKAKSRLTPAQSETPSRSLSGEIEILAGVLGPLYDISRHRNPDTLGQTIVSAVSQMIACDSAVFARIDPATRSFSFVAWPANRFISIDHAVAARLHLEDHPLVAHFAARRDAKAWSLHDLITQDAFHRTALYQMLYRPLGIEFQLVLLVPYPDRAPRVLAVNRRNEPFPERDRQILEMIWPHLTQAVRASRASARQRDNPDIDALSAGRGVILLDRAGHVDLCTEQARVWLTRYCIDGFARREIRSLPEPIAGWVGNSLGHYTLHSRGIADRAAPLILRHGDQFLTVRLVADHGRGQHLLIMDEASMNTPPALLHGLGLTPREAEVLAWVAQGKTNAETAIILGMSTRTVQKHMEHIFTKLGVESRTSAILKAWQAGRYEDLRAQATVMPPLN